MQRVYSPSLCTALSAHTLLLLLLVSRIPLLLHLPLSRTTTIVWVKPSLSPLPSSPSLFLSFLRSSFSSSSSFPEPVPVCAPWHHYLVSTLLSPSLLPSLPFPSLTLNHPEDTRYPSTLSLMPLKSPGHHSGRTKKLGSSPSTSGGRLGEERYEEVHVPLNDDAAEKTERRRSGGSSSRRRSGLGLNAPKTRAVIGAAGDGYSEGLSGKGLLTQVLSPEELNRQYEEWMKIAADNVSHLLTIARKEKEKRERERGKGYPQHMQSSYSFLCRKSTPITHGMWR